MKTGTAQITVGESRRAAERFTGVAVVVDVLRCSTTLCALLACGKKDVRVYADKAAAVEARLARPETEFFSELEYPPGFEKFDNSPWQALHADPSKPAISITGAGTQAMLGCTSARRILAGCFANIPYIAPYLRGLEDEVMIVPACLFFHYHIEDVVCAHAIADAVAGKDTADKAIARLMKNGRAEEFLEARKATGEKDVALALKVGTLKAIPEISLRGKYGQVTNALPSAREP